MLTPMDSRQKKIPSAQLRKAFSVVRRFMRTRSWRHNFLCRLGFDQILPFDFAQGRELAEWTAFDHRRLAVLKSGSPSKPIHRHALYYNTGGLIFQPTASSSILLSKSLFLMLSFFSNSFFPLANAISSFALRLWKYKLKGTKTKFFCCILFCKANNSFL